MNFLMAGHRAGRLCGIEVHIAYSLYLLAGLFALDAAAAGWAAALGILCLPLFVLLHELGHSLAAQSYGVPVRRIVLLIIGGAAELGGHIPGPRAEIVVALAGPAVSFFLAVLAFGGLALTGGESYFLQHCLWANLLLGVFNLLPVFPLDGGRVALATAVLKLGPARAVGMMRPLSALGAVFLALLGAWQIMGGNLGGIFLLFIAFMLYTRGGQELQARQHMAVFNQAAGLYQPNDYVVYAETPAAAKKRKISRWWQARQAAKAAKRQAAATELAARVDEVLAKVKSEGIANLSPGEKALLHKASENLRRQ